MALFRPHGVSQALEYRMHAMALPALAECILARYLPSIETELGLDLMSVACNVSGAAVAGLLLATEQYVRATATQRICSLVRLRFLGVWTSLPFVVVHAAQVSVDHGLAFGVVFLALSLGSACGAFALVRAAAAAVLRNHDWQVWVHEHVGVRHVRTQLL